MLAAANDIGGLELACARAKSHLEISSRALLQANRVAQTHLADIEDLKHSSMALKTREQAVEVGLQAANSRLASSEMGNTRLEVEKVGWVKEREMLEETNLILGIKVTERDRKADKDADRWQRQEDAMVTELKKLQEECEENEALAHEANRVLREEVNQAKEGKVAAEKEVEAGLKREQEIQARLDRSRKEYRERTSWGVKKQIELVDKHAEWARHCAGQDQDIAKKSTLIAEQARIIADLTRRVAGAERG